MSVIGQARAHALPTRARAIVQGVADRHGVTLLDIMGDDRGKRASHPRMLAWVELRSMHFGSSQASLPQIGAWFGRDHTTILSGLRKMGAGKLNQPGIYGIVAAVRAETEALAA